MNKMLLLSRSGRT